MEIKRNEMEYKKKKSIMLPADWSGYLFLSMLSAAVKVYQV